MAQAVGGFGIGQDRQGGRLACKNQGYARGPGKGPALPQPAAWSAPAQVGGNPEQGRGAGLRHAKVEDAQQEHPAGPYLLGLRAGSVGTGSRLSMQERRETSCLPTCNLAHS